MEAVGEGFAGVSAAYAERLSATSNIERMITKGTRLIFFLILVWADLAVIRYHAVR